MSSTRPSFRGLSALKDRPEAGDHAVREGERTAPHIRSLEEFLVHGLKYVFIPEKGALTRGILTAHAAPPLNKHFASTREPPPVWPDPKGKARGMAFSPLYKLAPRAAAADPRLYELLAILDAIRSGRAREREAGIRELKQRLRLYA